jgi:hypothetical protein
MTRRDGWRLLPVLLLTFGLGFAPPDTPRTVDSELLGLVPPDAAATLVISDLRGHAADFVASSLMKSFVELPSVKEWWTSGRGRQLEQSKAEIERTLGTTLKAIRDDLLGDAVVFALHLPADAPVDSARGLFLTRVRDRDLLIRLITFANKTDASFDRVDEAGTKDRTYAIRRFKPGEPREAEYYRLFDDGTFAWSNSEALIQGVLDRKAGTGHGLGDDPSYRKVRAGLPARSLATLHLTPAFVARVVASTPRPASPKAPVAAEVASSYLRAIRGVGLAIEWRHGFLLHSHETIDPQGLDPRLLQWAKARSNPDTLTRRIPATAVAAAAAPIDVEAAYDALVELVPTNDRPRLDVMLVALKGMLLGRDVRNELLPRLGPALIAYVEEPGKTWPRFPLVGVLELREDSHQPGIAAALDNALRTILSLYALDPKRQASRLRLISKQSGPVVVTSLADPTIPFAYAVGPDVFIIGTSVDAVARFGTSSHDVRLAPFKADHFPDARVYAALDVKRVVQIARDHRDDLARRLAKSRGTTPDAAIRDLDKALALVDLFAGAFFAIEVASDLTSIHQSVGLIAPDRQGDLIK